MQAFAHLLIWVLLGALLWLWLSPDNLILYTVVVMASGAAAQLLVMILYTSIPDHHPLNRTCRRSNGR